MRRKFFILTLLIVFFTFFFVVILSHKQVSNQSSQTAKSNKTNNEWKTYTSNEFTFNYPEKARLTIFHGSEIQKANALLAVACGWTCVKNSTLVGFSVNKVSYVTAEDFINSDADIKFDPLSIDIGHTVIDSLPATEILIPPHDGVGLVKYFLVHNNKGYVLTYDDFKVGEDKHSNKIKDLPKPNPDILSTFHFMK